MKYIRKIIVSGLIIQCLLFSLDTYSNSDLTRSIFADDFGGYQFEEEIYEIINDAISKKISFVEFNIVENRPINSYPKQIINSSDDSNASSHTKWKCYITSDSTITIFKDYRDGSRCYLSGYYFKNIMGIYCLEGTFPISQEYLSDNCKDINENYYTLVQTSIYQSGDTAILKKCEHLRKIIDNDTIDLYEDPWIAEYYFDKNGIYIKKNNSHFYSYPSATTRNTVIFQNDGLIVLEKRVTSKKNISKTKFVKKDKFISSNSFISDRTGKKVSSGNYNSVIKQEFVLNDKLMPDKITVLESTGSSSKVKGSFIEIKYN